MPYQFNMLHVLPQDKWPLDVLPIDIFISNQVQLLKRKQEDEEKRLAAQAASPTRRQDSQAAFEKKRVLTAREELENHAIESGLFMIPEYQFDHCFFQTQPSNLMKDPSSNMQEIYSRCANFLRLDQRSHLGITIVLTPKWFFATLIAQPYAYAPNGNPCYLDGIDFTGMCSIQLTTQTFPGVAKLHD